jgi:hypothetical protein
MIGLILAAGMVATALAESNPAQPDQAVINSTEAPVAIEKQVERGGSMMGYQILWRPARPRKKEHIHHGYQRPRPRISARSGDESSVRKAHLWPGRAQPFGSSQLRFEARMKTGLSEQVSGTRSKTRERFRWTEKRECEIL